MAVPDSGADNMKTRSDESVPRSTDMTPKLADSASSDESDTFSSRIRLMMQRHPRNRRVRKTSMSKSTTSSRFAYVKRLTSKGRHPYLSTSHLLPPSIPSQSPVKRRSPKKHNQLPRVRLQRFRSSPPSSFSFATTLSIRKAPLKFFDMPRELRDRVYGELLTFANKTSLTFATKKERARLSSTQKLKHHFYEEKWRTYPLKLWSHPLFHTSSQLRREAGEWYYRTNNFGLRKPKFNVDLGYDLLPKAFFYSIRTLSITITAFDWGTKTFCTKISLLKGLRNVNIYLNWGKILHSQKRHDRLAVEAFKLLLNRCATPDSTSCYTTERASNYARAYLIFERFRSDIESLDEPSHRFAAMMHIFRQNKRDWNAPGMVAEEVDTTRNLIAIARREIEEYHQYQLMQKQEEENSPMELDYSSDGTVYPVSFEILTDGEFHIDDWPGLRRFKFFTLHPELKINVWDCPLKGREGRGSDTKQWKKPWTSDYEFQDRVMALRDPRDCCAERESGKEHVEEFEDDALTPTLMTTEEILECLDEVLGDVETVEENTAAKVKAQNEAAEERRKEEMKEQKKEEEKNAQNTKWADNWQRWYAWGFRLIEKHFWEKHFNGEFHRILNTGDIQNSFDLLEVGGKVPYSHGAYCAQWGYPRAWAIATPKRRATDDTY